MITSVALTSAMPIIQKLEPQSKAKKKLLITLVQLIFFFFKYAGALMV